MSKRICHMAKMKPKGSQGRALRWALGPSLGNILLLGVYQPETDFWAHQSVPTRLRDRPPSQPPALALMEVMQAPATLTSLADRGEAALALLDGACTQPGDDPKPNSAHSAKRVA